MFCRVPAAARARRTRRRALARGAHPADERRADRWALLRRTDAFHASRNDPAGPTIAMLGSCDGRAPEAHHAAVCWFDGTRWRTRRVEGDSLRLRSLHGDQLACTIQRTCDARPGESCLASEERVVPLGGEGTGLRLGAEDPQAVLEDPRFLPDGEIVATVRRPGPIAFGMGPPEQPLTVRVLPDGARSFDFADRLHGLAAGPDAAQLWTTADGGRSWDALHLPVDGRAEGTAFRPGERTLGDVVVCSHGMCVVGDRVAWASERVIGAPTATPLALASTHPTPPEPEQVAHTPFGPAAEHYVAGSWRCEPPASVAPLAVSRSYGADGWIEWRPVSATEVRLHWEGQDRRGRFEATATASALPARVGPHGRSIERLPERANPEMLPRVLTRTLALLERCPGTGSDHDCDLLVASAGGAPHELGRVRALGGLEGPRGVARVEAALPLPDGGAVVLLRVAPATQSDPARIVENVVEALSGGPQDRPASAASFDVVLEVGPTGDLVRRRDYVSPAMSYRMLAVGPEGPGLVIAARPSSVALTFYPVSGGEDGRALGRLPAGVAPRVCGDGEAHGTELLTGGGGYGAAFAIGERFSTVATVLDVGASGDVCVRGGRFWWPSGGSDEALRVVEALGGAPTFRSQGASLQGLVGATELACRRVE